MWEEFSCKMLMLPREYLFSTAFTLNKEVSGLPRLGDPRNYSISVLKCHLLDKKRMINPLYTESTRAAKIFCFSSELQQYLLETCTQDWPGRLSWRLSPQTTALWSRKMWKHGEITGKSWWNEVSVAGQGTGTDREFVSGRERFTSSPRAEGGFRKEQYLPFNQRRCQAVHCPLSCLCPFPSWPKLFRGIFKIHICFGWWARLNPCHEMCAFQSSRSRNFRPKGKVRDLPGFPTGRVLLMEQILHPMANRRVGEPSTALTHPKPGEKWGTPSQHPARNWT